MDIRREPLTLLSGVQQFVEHRIHLMEVKGLAEFLKGQAGRTLR